MPKQQRRRWEWTSCPSTSAPPRISNLRSTPLTRERCEFVVVFSDLIFSTERPRIAALAIAALLPSMYGQREHVDDGGLISYGVAFRENWRRSAYFVDKILKGTKPADLPVELPAKLELVINLKTAKALGI